MRSYNLFVKTKTIINNIFHYHNFENLNEILINNNNKGFLSK